MAKLTPLQDFKPLSFFHVFRTICEVMTVSIDEQH